MTLLAKGRYRVFEACGRADIDRALALRARMFAADRRHPDDHDARCRHVLVEDRQSGEPVCTFRLLRLGDGREIGASYAASQYRLDALAAYPGRMAELGRFCIRPGHADGDILRLAWGALTGIVDREGVDMLFGCASFAGADPRRHADAFALLAARHMAPPRWRPRIRAPRILRFSPGRAVDARRAMAAMPPLLRSYLAMGAWVSDHAVVDHEMDTMHVFTAVEIGAIPPARQRLLRAVAG